jgi:hypothetical protein
MLGHRNITSPACRVRNGHVRNGPRRDLTEEHNESDDSAEG